MSQDVDRLIDSAFEHDRERLPAAKPGVPSSLVKKASQSVGSSGAAALPVWLKLAAGVIAVGGVTAYFVTRKAPVPPTPIPPPPAVVIDSPVVADSVVLPRQAPASQSRAEEHRTRVLPPVPSSPTAAPPMTLPPAIRDSTLHARDSIRHGRSAH